MSSSVFDHGSLAGVFLQGVEMSSYQGNRHMAEKSVLSYRLVNYDRCSKFNNEFNNLTALRTIISRIWRVLPSILGTAPWPKCPRIPL